jgi:nucleoside-diphosphate-sugar epimerase
MNILLTGSDGFIGSHLFYALKEEHNVYGFDLKNGHNILQTEFPKDIDLVIHLAGLSGVRDSLNRPTDYWTTNVIGTQRLFENYKDVRIIYASSSTAHEPWKNPYAMSKYSMEQLNHNNAVGMRFTTVYGPGARVDMLIPKILRNDVQYLNVNHIRDFIHVNDIVSAVEIMMTNTFRGVVDVGTGISNKLVDIADYFKIDYKSMIGGETERLDNTADTSILNKFGWRAKINLYNYIEENKNVN